MLNNLSVTTCARKGMRLSFVLGVMAVALAGSPAHAQQASGSYLESAGIKVPLPDSPKAVGKDANPLLNNEAGEKDAGVPSFTHQGNVGRTSNVPAPGKTLALAADPRPSQQAGQSQSEPAQQNEQADNVAVVDALPNPRVDIPSEVLNRLAPANAEELRAIVEQLYLRQGAASTPPRPGILGKSSQYVVDLSPGASPPVIRVARGIGATVNFVDSAGNPWPITFANNFYAQAARVTQMAPHVLSVASISPHLSGSVGVMLEGLTTPVNFIVTPGQEETDYRVDLHIPGLAPDAPPVPGGISQRPGLAGNDLMGFMYGATPDGATRLEVIAPGAAKATTRAWQDAKGRLILRTHAQIQSPGWYQRLPALDGTSVYELPPTSVVRVSVDGQTQSFTIKGLVPRTAQAPVGEGMKKIN